MVICKVIVMRITCGSRTTYPHQCVISMLLTLMFSILVYSSGSIPDRGGLKQPVGWTGPGPVLHWSLDNLEGLVLMEGTQQKDYDALTDGKVTQLSPFFL